ncbi:glucosaminidase domain-containing protein [Bacillus sp. FJAT-28004]|uniref:glucosaminidase domain-containing protein n=1 Tax=Bacillus sp. FJAT-28004 TaxID=1679165 RepID=UPI0006B5A9A1|nr:glucosaminidase domain-containing protein [Bacillus sp. FJAT-28004]
MRKKLNQHLFVYLLVLSLVITLGMYVQPLNNESDSQSLETPAIESLSLSNLSPLAVDSLELIDKVTASPTPAPVSPTFNEISAETVNSSEQPLNTPHESNLQVEQPPAIVEKLTNTYEVTAYYLNIRTKPSANSDIIKVVEKGSKLEITEETDNGWLKLQDGGFVHGGYAKKVKKEVTVLSFASEAIPQPTITRNEKSEEMRLDKIEILEEAVEEVEEELTKPTSTVESDSGLTIEHIEKIFEGTALSGHDLEQAILEVEEEYGINAYFTIAVMKLESGNGKSRLAKSKNNLFGLNAIDGDKYNKAFSFKTKGDSVRKFGQLLSKHYVGKGLTTIEKVARKYCPSNSKWPSLVKNIMKRDYSKL